MCRNEKDVVILRTAHGVCLLLLSGASLLPAITSDVPTMADLHGVLTLNRTLNLNLQRWRAAGPHGLVTARRFREGRSGTCLQGHREGTPSRHLVRNRSRAGWQRSRLATMSCTWCGETAFSTRLTSRGLRTTGSRCDVLAWMALITRSSRSRTRLNKNTRAARA